MAILFDENPYIYYNDTWYNLGDSVEINEGDGFWLYAKIRCTYALASLGVTVRLIVDTAEVGKEYTSINCNGAVTEVWVYCTATKEGTAKAELWMGDMNQLIETKYSWAISFPEAPITCDGATPNFDTGCALLLYFDTDNNGIISAAERDNAWEAEFLGYITHNEAQFVEDAYNAGSINAPCPGCFVAPSLVISPTTHSSPSGGDTFAITVTSNIAWTVSDDSTWIHYTPSSGSGNGTITVTVDENTGTATRTGNVFATGEGITRTCAITQSGAEPTTCGQLVKVLNKDTGAGVEGVTVAARPTAGMIIRCTTDSLGKGTLTDLIEGNDYRLVVETYPAGWECQYTVDCEEDIKACETERTFRLKWIAPLTCDQPVKVVNKDTPTEGIEGVVVAAWQSGAKVKDCITGSDGKCTISALNRDQMYDIEVESYPASWECEETADCEYNMQMACDAEIVLKLKEEIEGPYGVIAEGHPKISDETCLDTCENENPCTADEGDRPDFEVEYKNAGSEEGYFQAFLIGYNGIGIDAPDAPEGKGKVFDSEFYILPTSFKLVPGESRTVTLTPKLLCGSMPNTDWYLEIKIAHITSLGFFEEWNDTKTFKVCYSQISAEGYTVELNPLPEEIHVDDTIQFIGKLSNSKMLPVENKEITIWEQDVFFDDEVASGTTESDGSFSIPWIVRKMEGLKISSEQEAEFRAYYLKGEGDLETKSNLQKTIIKGRGLTMAMVYGGVAVGLYVAGIFVPKLGKLVQAGSLIPAGLAGYEIYLWTKEKIPFLSTELKQLALPLELTEPLRKKKLVLL